MNKAGATGWPLLPRLHDELPVIVTRMFANGPPHFRGRYTPATAHLLARADNPAGSADGIAGWTPSRVKEFFARDGMVTAIWRKHHIALRLVTVRDCWYRPENVRLDGSPVDSMPTPESGIPWATGLFPQINRRFVVSSRPALHILLWWSIVEGRVFPPHLQEQTSLAKAEPSDANVMGYARAAGRGGPVVWADAFSCFHPLVTGFQTSCPPAACSHTQMEEQSHCARNLAHEIGHALRLHHVDRPDCNLMYPRFTGDWLTAEQKQVARDEVRQQFNRE